MEDVTYLDTGGGLRRQLRHWGSTTINLCQGNPLSIPFYSNTPVHREWHQTSTFHSGHEDEPEGVSQDVFSTIRDFYV